MIRLIRHQQQLLQRVLQGLQAQAQQGPPVLVAALRRASCQAMALLVTGGSKAMHQLKRQPPISMTWAWRLRDVSVLSLILPLPKGARMGDLLPRPVGTCSAQKRCGSSCTNCGQRRR